ncbi:hypothetical protein CEXT_516181 [Caerostris extrusa]|uniref:Uncharacterized protein n=1 Tax=Caerostris extrusa TaxID=172846 RepID=A0AAV4NA98_CAEEX|nr:hypothetical protein CEXT_516181 [Caerostris extrusa]
MQHVTLSGTSVQYFHSNRLPLHPNQPLDRKSHFQRGGFILPPLPSLSVSFGCANSAPSGASLEALPAENAAGTLDLKLLIYNCYGAAHNQRVSLIFELETPCPILSIFTDALFSHFGKGRCVRRKVVIKFWTSALCHDGVPPVQVDNGQRGIRLS